MNLSQYKEKFDKTVEHLKMELSALRTGRATPALVENIEVEAYGAKMQIKGLAGINAPDSKTVIIDPWDKSILKTIEKGIRDANIGLNPVVDGVVIRLNMPSLTEENRKELVKIIQKLIEETRVAIRRVREEIKDEILKAEEDKEITEDERFKMQDELDKMTKDYNEKVKVMGERKEEEIMTI